jgi:hypothetical protein
VGSSKPVQPRVVKLSETVRLRDAWAAREDELCRSGGELLEESASLTCAEFGRVRDARHCLLSYNPHQWYTTGESSICLTCHRLGRAARSEGDGADRPDFLL